MRRPLLFLLLSGAAAGACETSSSAVGLNGPCERTADCVGGLSCEAGVCVGADEGAPDASFLRETGVADATPSNQ